MNEITASSNPAVYLLAAYGMGFLLLAGLTCRIFQQRQRLQLKIAAFSDKDLAAGTEGGRDGLSGKE